MRSFRTLRRHLGIFWTQGIFHLVRMLSFFMSIYVKAVRCLVRCIGNFLPVWNSWLHISVITENILSGCLICCCTLGGILRQYTDLSHAFNLYDETVTFFVPNFLYLKISIWTHVCFISYATKLVDRDRKIICRLMTKLHLRILVIIAPFLLPFPNHRPKIFTDFINNSILLLFKIW